MRTEADLIDAFRALERLADEYGTPSFRTTAPPPAAPSPRGSHTRLAVSMLAAAAAVLGAIGIAAVAVHGGSDSTAPPAGRTVAPTTPPVHPTPAPSTGAPTTPTPSTSTTPAPTAQGTFDPHRLSFSLDRVDGMTPVQARSFRDVQELQVRSGASRWDVMLTAPGTWGPPPVSDEGLLVAGRRATYGPATATLPMAVQAENPVVLAWQYLPGAWGIVVSEDSTPVPLATARVLAEAVRPGVSEDVRLPLRITANPAGMTLQGFVAETGAHAHGEPTPAAVTVDFTRTGAATDLTVDLTGPVATGTTYPGAPVTVRGRAGYLQDGALTVVLDDGHVLRLSAVGDAAATVTGPQLVALASAIEPARDLTDPTTWFAPPAALP